MKPLRNIRQNGQDSECMKTNTKTAAQTINILLTKL